MPNKVIWYLALIDCCIKQMLDQKIIDSQLKNYKVREGPLYKRSKFLKEWRERWIVLTMNYFFTFTNKTCQEITDVIDLKEIKSYKSYTRKDEEMIPSGFKIRSLDNMYYFCAKNCYQKWSWLVSFERVMDYKYAGASTYNNLDFIKTNGFPSQQDFESNKFEKAVIPNLQANTSAEQTKKEVDLEAEKILKQLQSQQEQLKHREQEFQRKQRQLDQQEAMFRLKKTESEKAKVQIKPVVETPEQRAAGNRVSELKHLYEKKMEESSKSLVPNTIKLPSKEQKKTESQAEVLNISRSRVIFNIFEEFNPEAYQYEGLKYIIDFLIKISIDRNLGYQAFVVYEAKTNANRVIFAQILIELLTDYKEYEKAELFCRFLEVMIFEAAGIFTPSQLLIIQNKMLDFFKNITDEKVQAVVLKSMFILHKIRAYPKNEELKNKLNKIIKETKWEETRNWARKLHDEL